MPFTESARGAAAGASPRDGESPLKHVLVPLDGSPLAERALPFAQAIARGFTARTTLLRVVTPPSIDALPVNPLEWERARLHAERYLEEIAKQWDTSLQCVVEQGRAAARILDYAHENAVDLIVLHSHGEGGPSPWRLSHTAQMIAGSAATSLLVVPLHDGEPEVEPITQIRRLLVTLDCSPRAECVLPAVARLSRALDAETLLCHVVEEPEMPRRLGAAPEDVDLAGRLVARNVQEATKYLERMRSRMLASGVRCETRLVTANHAADAIRDLAARERVDLIIACAHGNGASCERTHGSVARMLAHDPTRPLLILQDTSRPVPPRSAPERTPIARRGA